MNCRETTRDIYPYLDGELLPQEASALEAHIELCETCAQNVSFEANFLKETREKLEPIDASASLKLRIQESIANEARENENPFLAWLGLTDPNTRFYFGSAMVTALLVATTVQIFPTQTTLEEGPNPSRQVISAGQTTPLSYGGMTADTSPNVPNPVFSLISDDITQSALGSHRNTDPNGFEPDLERVWRRGGRTFDGLEPPLREGAGRRLLGARVQSTGLVASVVYDYEVHGLRMTAVQAILPRGWGRQGRFYHVDEKDGLTVLTYQQSENVLTSFVSSAQENELRQLLPELDLR